MSYGVSFSLSVPCAYNTTKPVDVMSIPALDSPSTYLLETSAIHVSRHFCFIFLTTSRISNRAINFFPPVNPFNFRCELTSVLLTQARTPHAGVFQEKLTSGRYLVCETKLHLRASLRANVARGLIKAIYQSFRIDSKWDLPYFHVIYCLLRENPWRRSKGGRTRVYRGTNPPNQFSRNCKTDVVQVIMCACTQVYY